MAKMTIDNVTYEGTPEELREIVRSFEEAEADVKATPKTNVDFAKGDKVRLLSGGGDFPLRGLVDGGLCTVLNPYYKHTKGILVKIETAGGHPGYATPEQLEKVADSPAETLTFEGADYALVSRKAQAGDVVVLTETGGDVFETGKPYAVKDDVRIADGGKPYDLYREHLERTESTVLVYEKVAEALKVGDMVEVIDGSKSRHGDFPTGTIGKITLFSGDFGDTNIRVDTDDDYDRFPATALRKLTDEEITKRVRLIPEKGDIVRVTLGYESIKDGDIGEVISADGTDCPRVKVGDATRYVTVEVIARKKDRVDVA